MRKSIQISKRSTIYIPDISSFKLVVETLNAENMSDKIFVNQRIRNFAKEQFDDTFVAVCTPVQLEDFAEDSPEEDTSFYRTNSIELIGRTPEYLQTVFESLVYEVKKLVLDLEQLDSLSEAEIYTITSEEEILMTPSAPTITAAEGGNGEIAVYFTPPESNGGSVIINYEYTLNDGFSWVSRSPVSVSSPLKIYGLENNSIYRIKLRAANKTGAGLSSAKVYAAPTLPGVPNSPVITGVYTDVDDSLAIEFNRPISTGGSTITGYQYSLDAGDTWQEGSNALKINVTNIVLNQTYYVSVRAKTSTIGVYGAKSTPVQYEKRGIVGSLFTGSEDSNWSNLNNWTSQSGAAASSYPQSTTAVTLDADCVVDVDAQSWIEPSAITIGEYNIVFNSSLEPHPIISCDITATTGTVTFNGVDYGAL